MKVFIKCNKCEKIDYSPIKYFECCSLRYLTVYISSGGMLTLCTNLCSGISTEPDRMGPHRDDQTSSQMCSAECMGKSGFVWHTVHPTSACTLSKSRANKMMKGKLKHKVCGVWKSFHWLWYGPVIVLQPYLPVLMWLPSHLRSFKEDIYK